MINTFHTAQYLKGSKKRYTKRPLNYYPLHSSWAKTQSIIFNCSKFWANNMHLLSLLIKVYFFKTIFWLFLNMHTETFGLDLTKSHSFFCMCFSTPREYSWKNRFLSSLFQRKCWYFKSIYSTVSSSINNQHIAFLSFFVLNCHIIIIPIYGLWCEISVYVYVV